MLRPAFLRVIAVAVVLGSGALAYQTGSAATGCVTASFGGWQNLAFAAQTATFTAVFDATPGRSPGEAMVGLSNGPQTQDSGFAASVRFNNSGRIDARAQGSFTAASSIPYTANTTYHVRLVVNPAAHRYSAFVTPPGGSELTVATNIAFRSEQSNTSTLSNRG